MQLNTIEPIEIVAHRGAGGQAFIRPNAPPENTMPSFAEGWKEPLVHANELDVHLTSDNHVIVIHDDTTDRTANTNVQVKDYTLAELQNLDAGGWKGKQWSGEKFPTLAEVLKTIPDGKRLFIEIKTGPKIVEHLAQVIKDSGKGPEHIVFISFNYAAICAAKQAMPDYACYFLVVFEWDAQPGQWKAGYFVPETDGLSYRAYWQTPADLDEIVRMVYAGNLDGLDVSEAQPDEFFSKMRAAKIDWKVWTVDTVDAALSMAVKGASSITSNRAEFIAETLQNHGFVVGPSG